MGLVWWEYVAHGPMRCSSKYPRLAVEDSSTFCLPMSQTTATGSSTKTGPTIPRYARPRTPKTARPVASPCF